MGGGKDLPAVPEPTPPPKPKAEVDVAFRQARNRARQRPTRGLPGTDITGGLLSQLSLGKKTLLGQ